MSYVLKQFNNDQSPVNGRWFAYVNRPGILSTRGLANHMVEHGMTNKADVLAMLVQIMQTKLFDLHNFTCIIQN